jgi:hypothetical protein
MYRGIAGFCDNFIWIICFDSPVVLDVGIKDDRVHLLAHKDHNSISGNAQRNKCLEYAEQRGLCDGGDILYCLDDDNVIHKDLYAILFSKEYDNNNLFNFTQVRVTRNGTSVYLEANGKYSYGAVDSGNHAFRYSLLKGKRWHIDKYEADAIFAHELKSDVDAKPVSIHRELAYYNKLK